MLFYNPTNFKKMKSFLCKQAFFIGFISLVIILGIVPNTNAQKKAWELTGYHKDTCTASEMSRQSFIDVPKSNTVYWKLQQQRQELQKNGNIEEAIAKMNSIKTATINIVFGDGFAELGSNEQAAKDAFRFAADIWETEVVSDVPITISANFRNFGSSSIIGSNSSPLFINTPNAPEGVIYTSALARAIAGFDFTPGTADGNQNYNLEFDFYFGTDGQVPSNKIDFITVVLHEIGHTMGITGLSNNGTGVGTSFQGEQVYTGWTNFVELGDGTPITEVADTDQPDALTSNDLFYEGPNTKDFFDGRPKVYAPSTFRSGSSYSHWDEATFRSGTPNALMTPSIARGEVNRNVGDITRGALKDQGWVLSSDLIEPNTVASFTLIRGNSNQELFPLTDGSVLDVNELGTNNFAVRANTFPDEVGSVKFELSGPISITRTENIAPYALFGDNLSLGGFNGQGFPDGEYTLTATPFTGSNLSGDEGTALTINFEVINIQISNLLLIDANTDDILFPIGESNFIILDNLPKELNIQAITTPETVGSVLFEIVSVDGNSRNVAFSKVESISPYAMFGDDPRGDFNGGSLAPFALLPNVFIEVTPFSERGGNGTPGTTLRIQLNLFGGSPAITSLVLVNSNTNEPVPGFENLNGTVNIPLNVVGDALSVEALVNSTTSSIQFSLNGPDGLMQSTENIAPYALFADQSGSFNPWNPAPQDGQSFELTVTPFDQSGGVGKKGVSKVVTFNFTGQASSTEAFTVQAYPNPGEDHLKLSSAEACKKGHLEVFNTYGQKVFEKDWEGKLDETLDLSNEMRGIYMIKIMQDGQETFKRVLLR